MIRKLDPEISSQIREEASELLTEMETALLELEESPDDIGLVNRVFRAMHTVKGAANMFGLDKVANLTHEVETAFDLVRNGKLAVSRDLLDLGLEARDHIWLLIDAPEDADEHASHEVMRRIKNLVTGVEKAATLTEREDAPSQASVKEDSSANVHNAGRPTPIPEDDGRAAAVLTTYSIRFRPSGEGLLVHADPLAILDELRDLNEAGECVVVVRDDAVPPLESMEPESCVLWWEVLLTTSQDKNAIRDAFIFVEDMSDIAFKEVSDAAAWLEEHHISPVQGIAESSSHPFEERSKNKDASSEAFASHDITPPPPLQDSMTVVSESEELPSPSFEPASVVSPVAVPVPPDAAQEEGSMEEAADDPSCEKTERSQTPRKEVATSIRVDAYKLDDMVALVGELVIAQARLMQLSAQSHNPQLQGVAEELELLSSSLRDRTLSMRMLPIGTTFDRFRRLVRDLSHELGKEVELHTHGADTELDKTVIEQLGDPLVHLLRNSIDHGLESPEQRIAAGKPSKGTIVLSAEHSGGHVLIRIFDDGRGMSRERIAAKGVERNLISDPAALSDKEIYKLVFHPGFSTAAKVSSVSGRGVGMDVVKRGIEALRGSVDIESEEGAGTTVTVKLPLTLAIIEGLQVRVGDEYFVIPLAAVQECVELTGADRGSDAGGNGKRLINLRDAIVPYIRLREWFEIHGEQPDIEQIIIVGDENTVTGIVVDEVIGQQQTVIKSLGRMFRDVEEFSGATIKGDGTMALILDVPQLVRKVMIEAAASA